MNVKEQTLASLSLLLISAAVAVFGLMSPFLGISLGIPAFAPLSIGIGIFIVGMRLRKNRVYDFKENKEEFMKKYKFIMFLGRFFSFLAMIVLFGVIVISDWHLSKSSKYTIAGMAILLLVFITIIQIFIGRWRLSLIRKYGHQLHN